MRMVDGEDEAAARARELIATSFRDRLSAYPSTHHRHYLIVETLVDGIPTLAACAYIAFANEQPLFSETYFSEPIQREVADRLDVDINRSAICEIGGLSTDATLIRSVRDVVAYFPWFLGRLGYKYALVTVTSYMRLAFAHSGTNFQTFCPADPSKLTADERERWGRYYHFDPHAGVIDLKLMDFIDNAATPTDCAGEMRIKLGISGKAEACS
jgi:hypothetical protein